MISYDKLERVITIFKHMSLYHGLLGDKIRQKAYLFAVSTLTDLLFNNVYDLDSIFKAKNIGNKMKLKIIDIMKTDTFPEYEALRKNPKIKTMIKLQDIYGIGPVLALRLYKKGINNISDLIKIKDKLPLPVQIGIKYRNELKKPIPKVVITMLLNELKIAYKNISNNKTDDVILCGSARRGLIPRDLDFIVVSSTIKISEIMDELFKRSKFKLIAVLAEGDKKYMAVIGTVMQKHNNIFKIDIRIVEPESRASAMLYFTGPKLFNIWMRSHAIEKGLLLNEYGLFKGTKRIKTETEKEIFDKLKVKYITPKQRNKISNIKVLV